MSPDLAPEQEIEEDKPKLTVVESREGADIRSLPEAESYLISLGQHMVECPICGNLEHAHEQEWPGIKICETHKNSAYGKAHPEALNKLRYRVKQLENKQR